MATTVAIVSRCGLTIEECHIESKPGLLGMLVSNMFNTVEGVIRYVSV